MPAPARDEKAHNPGRISPASSPSTVTAWTPDAHTAGGSFAPIAAYPDLLVELFDRGALD
ncbi:hypothetical protein D1872_297860 [compost metagenome]